MATAKRICRVCGCEYEYCHTAKRIAGVFRWQDVACSPEHGSTYLARIEASRAETSQPKETQKVQKVKASKTTTKAAETNDTESKTEATATEN